MVSAKLTPFIVVIGILLVITIITTSCNAGDNNFLQYRSKVETIKNNSYRSSKVVNLGSDYSKVDYNVGFDVINTNVTFRPLSSEFKIE